MTPELNLYYENRPEWIKMIAPNVGDAMDTQTDKELRFAARLEAVRT